MMLEKGGQFKWAKYWSSSVVIALLEDQYFAHLGLLWI